jgi:hypothetical protein
MKKPLFSLLLLASTLLVPAVRATDPAPGLDSKTAFQTLKDMAGTWEGKAEGMPYTVSYEIASGGSVVMERQFAHSDHEMINIYHIVDGELRLVHYCSMGNQPMMKLDTAASKPGDLVFAFAGGTNFDPAKDAHIHQARLRVSGDDLEADWGSYMGGKEAGSAKFQAHRTAKAEAPAAAPMMH